MLRKGQECSESRYTIRACTVVLVKPVFHSTMITVFQQRENLPLPQRLPIALLLLTMCPDYGSHLSKLVLTFSLQQLFAHCVSLPMECLERLAAQCSCGVQPLFLGQVDLHDFKPDLVIKSTCLSPRKSVSVLDDEMTICIPEK